MAAGGSVATHRPPGTNELQLISLALPNIGIFTISDYGSDKAVDCLHTLIHSVHVPLDPTSRFTVMFTISMPIQYGCRLSTHRQH